MSTPSSRLRNFMMIGAASLSVVMLPWSLVHAARIIEERRSVDPQGLVEIVDLAGSIELSAWDRPEIEVTGTAGDDVDRVDVTTAGKHTSIHVVLGSGISWRSGGGETRLVIHVPAKSAVSATLVTANIKVSGVLGDVNLRTVSGNVSGDVGGDLRANTVSGSVRMTAAKAQAIDVKTINGDIELKGGAGEVVVTTVSGNANVVLGTLTRGRFKSITGTMSASLSLAPAAQIEGESISGTIRFDFPTAPAAEFDVQTLSGSVDNCFGPKPSEARFGPGSRLVFQNGDGHARVRIETKSGDVHLCAAGMHREHVASVPAPRAGWRSVLYVL
jgi:DUF4097 and DUF4098 domain-containing protein YvlB